MRSFLLSVSAIFLVISIYSCSPNPEITHQSGSSDGEGKGNTSSSAKLEFSDVKSIFTSKCGSCHSSSGSAKSAWAMEDAPDVLKDFLADDAASSKLLTASLGENHTKIFTSTSDSNYKKLLQWVKDSNASNSSDSSNSGGKGSSDSESGTSQGSTGTSQGSTGTSQGSTGTSQGSTGNSNSTLLFADISQAFSACTSCHGSSGGFDAKKYNSVKAQVNLTKPEQSELLLKGSGQSNHGGGSKWSASDPSYQKVLQWIKDGAKNT